jgi:predicted nucleic acid-binding protein
MKKRLNEVVILIFVDASYIIALVVESDQWNENALKLIDKVAQSDKAITQAMIIETINLIGKCKGGKAGKSIYQYIKDNYTIYNKADLLDRAMKEFIKYNGTLSLADCTGIITMQDLNIHEIISFDDDFDKVDGIIRVK